MQVPHDYSKDSSEAKSHDYIHDRMWRSSGAGQLP